MVLLLSCGWGWLTHTYTSKTSSTVLPRHGVRVTLQSASAGERQGQLSCSHDLRDNSLTCHRICEVLKAFSPLTIATTRQMMSVVRSLKLMFRGGVGMAHLCISLPPPVTI